MTTDPGTDPLCREAEDSSKILNRTAKRFADGAESMKSAVDELVESSDALASVLVDTIGRLIELERKVAAIEAANDRRECQDREQDERR